MPAENPLTWFETFRAVNQQLIDRTIKQTGAPDASELSEILRVLIEGYASQPGRWAEIQNVYRDKQWQLWSGFARAAAGGEPPALVVPRPGDRRFHNSAWQTLPFFNYLKQSYLLSSEWLNELIESADLEHGRKKRVTFHTQQYLDAVAPGNFLPTNPEALQLALETKGQSIARGMANFAHDIERGRISMSDEDAFEVGKNLAITPGAVVFENDYMQLIQYAPLTAMVYKRPLLIVPPFINKFYILDLQPENSFVRYALAEGQLVFMISWRNATPELGAATWDDYVEHAVVKAMKVIRDIVRADKLNAVGFCVGGTLLSTALAVRRAKKRNPVASLTLLATMLDFTDPGKISVYIDDAYLRKCETRYAAGEVMPGAELASSFANLRANELVWFYVINNYLKGQRPRPFDLLFWNADSANLPGALYAFLIKNMYRGNCLKDPGKLLIGGVPVDLAKIDMPSYILASRDDHIVPWKSAYASTRLLSGDIEFVLAASGHIAGIVNPAAKGRRNYWVNRALPADGEQWLSGAESIAGSWWGNWGAWIARHSGRKVPAKIPPGNTMYRPIEAAPGRYVKESF